MKRFVYALLALAIGWSFGCDEDTQRPPAPTPPPPLKFSEVWSESAGPKFRLPDREVFDIFEDSQGRIWISTDNGIAMKDGNADVVVFNDFDGIRNRKCRGITELNGKIWVGTWGGGVSYYDGTLPWISLPIGGGRIVDGQVYDLAADDSSIWVGTVNGLTQYIDDDALPEASRYKQHTNRLGPTPVPRLDKVVTSVLVHTSATRGREIWLTKLGGGMTILRFRPDNSIQAIQMDVGSTGLPDHEVNDILYDPTSDLFWVALETKGLASIDVDAAMWTQYGTVNGLVSEVIRSLARRSDNGDLWLATQKGPTKIYADGTKLVNYTLGSGLPDERIRKVYVDSNNDVWMAFIDAGAAKVQNKDDTTGNRNLVN